MLDKLKEEVFKANIDLVKAGLVILTWGNASGIDRENGLIVIKPSGVRYSEMKPVDMVVIDMEGKVVEGQFKPSSDTPTHIELYKSFPEIGGVVHTHSGFATAWAQAGKSIPVLGTTHADCFSGPVPCTGDMTEKEIMGNYERETGSAIVKAFKNLNYHEVPGVLVKNHGPFTWGKNPEEAVYNSIVLEEVAKMAHLTLSVNLDANMNDPLTKKHYDRKHGKTAYYGQ